MEKIIFQVSDELYGISEGLADSGMILGALFAQMLSKKIPFGKIYLYFLPFIFLIPGMGICALPGVMNPSGTSYFSYGIFTLCSFPFALIVAVVNIVCMTYFQTEIPAEYMGKSMAGINALSMILMPAGQVIFGWLYDAFSQMSFLLYLLVSAFCCIASVITRRILLWAELAN